MFASTAFFIYKHLLKQIGRKCYSSPTKSGSVRSSLTVTVTGAKRKSLDCTLNVYVCPGMTSANEKKPNELVVADRTTLFESVIDTVALRSPRPSGVNTRPLTPTLLVHGPTAITVE